MGFNSFIGSVRRGDDISKNEHILLSDKDLEIKKFIVEHDFTVIKKSRQMGLTSILTLSVIERALNFDDYHIYYVNDIKSGGLFINKLFDIIRNLELPSNLIKTQNNRKIEFINGSSVEAIVPFPDKLYGKSVGWVIYDDFFDRRIEDFYNKTSYMAPSETLVHTPYPSEVRNLWKNLYFQSLIDSSSPYGIEEYMWFDNERFNSDLMYVRREIEIPYNSTKVRQNKMLEHGGFKLVSPEYQRYLNMYGYDDSFLNGEFEKFVDELLES